MHQLKTKIHLSGNRVGDIAGSHTSRLLFLFVAFALISAAGFAQVPTCTWSSTVSGNWSDEKNWTGPGCTTPGVGAPDGANVNITAPAAYTVTLDVPRTVGNLNVGTGSVDVATLSLGGPTLTINGNANIQTGGKLLVPIGTVTGIGGLFTTGSGKIDLSGGTISIGTVIINSGGESNWSGGTMLGPGVTDIKVGGVVNVTASTQLDARSLINSGTLNLIGGGEVLRAGNGAAITNDGTVDFQGNTHINYSSGVVPVFTNNSTGSVIKSAGLADAAIGVTFNNSGSVSSSSGELRIMGGGSGGGTFTANAGARIYFGGGIHNLTADMSGAGAFWFFGGTVNLDPPGSYNVNETRFVGGNFNLNAASSTNIGLLGSGSALGGSGTFTINGALTWSGATMKGTGTTVVAAPSGMVTVTGSAPLDTRSLVIDGTLVLNVIGEGIRAGNGATITNNGLVDFQNNSQINDFIGVPAPLFVNSSTGSVTKSAGTLPGSSAFDINVNNAGSISVLTGEMSFGRAFTQTGGSTSLSGGNISTSSVLKIDGGLLKGNGSITGNVANNGGVVGPGASAGQLDLVGNYTQAAGGAFDVELGGTTAGTQYDRLNVSGTATLDGTLNVSLISPFFPAHGDTFTIISGTTTGDFATKNGLDHGTITLVPSQASYILTAQGISTEADLSITKVDLADPVALGSDIQYLITVNNAGPAAATGVVVTDTLPTGTTFVSASPSQGSCSPSPTTVVCNLGSISSAGTATISLSLAASAAGTYVNSVSVSATESDPTPANNSTSESTVVASADLSVSKTVSPTTADAGQNFTYTIDVRNAGPSAATNVTMSDTIPSGMSVVSKTPSQGSCSTSPGTVTCDLGTLVNGASATIVIVTTSNVAGSHSNTASATATEPDPNSANNSASATVTVNAAADLSISKSGSPDPVGVGQNLTYTIVVANLGPSQATSVTMDDALPSSVTLVSATTTQGSCAGTKPVSCSIGTLLSGSSAVVTIVVKTTATGTLTNRAAVIALETDPVSSNNSVQAFTNVVAVSSADLHLVKTASVRSVGSGGTVLYELVVTNRGPAKATGVVVTDTLPPGAVVLSAETTRGSCSGTSTITCNLLDLDPGFASATITIRATLSGSGIVTNHARVTATEVDPNPQDNNASADVLVGVADLLVRKTGPAVVMPGDSVEYLIEVINASGAPVQGVRVRDVFPLDLVTGQYSCAAPAGGSCASLSGFGGIDTTVDLPAGGTARFTVIGQVSLSAKTNLVNVATITPPQGTDNNPANDSSRTDAVLDFPDCPVDYRVLVGVIPRNMSGIPFPVMVRNPLQTLATAYQFQLSADPNDFSNAETITVPSSSGKVQNAEVEISAYFVRLVAEGEQPFYARGRALDCNSEFFSPVVQITVVAEPNTFESDPQFSVDEDTTDLLEGRITFDAPEAPSGARTALNGTTVSITTDKTHLTVTPPTTTVPPGGTATVTVTANPNGLSTGTTTGTVLVTNPATGATTAVPVSVTLTTPLFPVGKTAAPPNALIVPVVARAQGVNSRWISDLRMTNTSPLSIQYHLTLTPSEQDGTQQGKQGLITLTPGQTIAFDNVAEQQFGVGSLGQSGSGVLEIRPLNFFGKTSQAVAGKAFLATVAASRTYNQAASGTVSQYIPGIPFSKAIRAPEPNRRSVLSIQHVTQSEETRTNLGFVEGSGQPATVTLRVFDLIGQLLDQFSVDLQPAEHKQLNAILASRQITLEEGRVEMEVTSPTGQILGYASVISAETNDPLFVPGVDLSQVATNKFVLPAVIHSGEVAETDVRIFNASAAQVNATLAFYRLNESAPARTASVSIAPGEVKVLDNILPATFGEANTTGTIQVTTAESVPLVVTARSRFRGQSGTTSQFVEAQTVNDSAGSEDRALQIVQVEESERFSSNVGVVEVTGNAVTVEISGVASDTKTEAKTTVELQPNELKQFGAILKQLGLGRVYNGRVAIKVVSGTGRILAYGSLIDAQTGDTTLIPAQ